jgi:hypothetical protein
VRRLWIFLLTAGCPEPVDELTPQTEAAAGPGGPGAPAGEMSSPPLDGGPGAAGPGAGTASSGGTPGQMTPPTGGLDVAAAPPTLGTFAGNLPDGELKPAYTQADLANGATISGTLKCDGCSGQLLVRVLPPPPSSPTIGAPSSNLQLITQATFPAAGAYTLQVPDGEPVVLQVVDDANKDGFPSQGERMGMRADGPVLAEGSLTGIDLTVGVFPEMAATVGTPGDLVGGPGGAPIPDGAPPPDNEQDPPDGAPMDGAPPDGTPPADG